LLVGWYYISRSISILSLAVYVSQKRSFQGLGTKNLWIPSKHKDVKNLATKGWTIWNGTDFGIDVLLVVMLVSASRLQEYFCLKGRKL